MAENTPIAAMLYGYQGENPFRDGQARMFTDEKVLAEFRATTKYWGLFNSQHEILLGTRGSGKTILLKMLRYSMLRKLTIDKATAIIASKSFVGIYVATNLEFVNLVPFKMQDTPQGMAFFVFAFNCLLANSLLTELSAMLEDQYPKSSDRMLAEIKLSKELNEIWGVIRSEDGSSELINFYNIKKHINIMYLNVNPGDDLKAIPKVFSRGLLWPLRSVVDVVDSHVPSSTGRNWVVCIDEAEFLPDLFQRCINSVMRSDSKGIVIKMATLPFKHLTRETLQPGVNAEADGNDFNYRSIDYDPDDDDFIALSDSICNIRFKRHAPSFSCPSTLGHFLGVIGHDNQKDYYELEFGPGSSNRIVIEREMILELNPLKSSNQESKSVEKKLLQKVYDKYAPVFYVRKIAKRHKKGAHFVGWYAGEKMIRKISQGNPRRLIQILNAIFEEAKKTTNYSPKTQTRAIFKYVKSHCRSTAALPVYGNVAEPQLRSIAEYLSRRVHEGYLSDVGSSFSIEIPDNADVEWIKLAVQYLRLTVDTPTLQAGITSESKFALANTYAASYFIPMRSGGYPKLVMNQNGEIVFSRSKEQPPSDFDEPWVR